VKVSGEQAQLFFLKAHKPPSLYGDPTKDGLFSTRFKLPKGYGLPPHTLSKAGLFTVISGTFFMGMGERADPRKGSYKDIPEPEALAGHVVIEIKAFGINHAEMHMRRGEWAEAAPVSGIECVGHRLAPLCDRLQGEIR
jgi:hypothetical protein